MGRRGLRVFFWGLSRRGLSTPHAHGRSKSFRRSKNTLSTVASLADHVSWQLSLLTDDGLIRKIGTAIIGNLNDDGYLVASIDEIAAMGGWPEVEVERVLAVIQDLDPIGVAARNLQECLLLQLRHLGFDGTPSETIVRDHIGPPAEAPAPRAFAVP